MPLESKYRARAGHNEVSGMSNPNLYERTRERYSRARRHVVLEGDSENFCSWS